MKIIIDTNIFLSALIKDSMTRKLIIDYDDKFLFPYYVLEEMEFYKATILLKSELDEYKLNSVLDSLLKKMLIVPKEILDIKLNVARDIVKYIDLKDANFITCALIHPGSVIWSNDKKLKEQDVVTVLNTKEIIEYFSKNDFIYFIKEKGAEYSGIDYKLRLKIVKEEFLKLIKGDEDFLMEIGRL